MMSETLAAALLMPKRRNGRASESLQTNVGRNFEAKNSQAALVKQSTSSWLTRLQTPSPDKAAAIPAAALNIVERTSASAKMRKSRLLVMRAFATAALPPIVRISESEIKTGARSGREKKREAGQASMHRIAVNAAPMQVDIQNTVDSRSLEGFGCLTSAVPNPASDSMLVRTMNGMASPVRPNASGPKSRARMGRTSS